MYAERSRKTSSDEPECASWMAQNTFSPTNQKHQNRGRSAQMCGAFFLIFYCERSSIKKNVMGGRSMPDFLYKYKSNTNLEYILDIIKNKRFKIT